MNKNTLWIIPLTISIILGILTSNLPLAIAVFIGTITILGIFYFQNEKKETLHAQVSITLALGLIIITTILISEFTTWYSVGIERAIVVWMGFYLITFSLKYQIEKRKTKALTAGSIIALLTIILTYYYTMY